jgi:ABC-type bacteriocin/lantibiotic exporter with double-glycine peptidase domain
MNSIRLLTDNIENLWYMAYGIIAGWGLTFTIVVVAIVLLFIRTINLQRRVDQLEKRIVHAERDYNLSVNAWKSK